MKIMPEQIEDGVYVYAEDAPGDCEFVSGHIAKCEAGRIVTKECGWPDSNEFSISYRYARYLNNFEELELCEAWTAGAFPVTMLEEA